MPEAQNVSYLNEWPMWECDSVNLKFRCICLHLMFPECVCCSKYWEFENCST